MRDKKRNGKQTPSPYVGLPTLSQKKATGSYAPWVLMPQPTSEGQNFDLAKYIVSSTRYEYSIQYIVSYDTIHCF